MVAVREAIHARRGVAKAARERLVGEYLPGRFLRRWGFSAGWAPVQTYPGVVVADSFTVQVPLGARGPLVLSLRVPRRRR